MADVIPVKKVPGGLAEFGAADKVPAENLPATEWAAETVSQAEAEAGTATTRRAWTAQRVAQAVRGALLTGLGTASAAVITATDSVLSAMGKLQAQITGLSTSKLDANANAVSATKLATARTIALTGDVTGSASFDGSSNISINAQVGDDSHTHSLANLGLGSAATRTALGTTGGLYSRDSILGTVSQSGGIPTGAIIERGSNANGEYVRFADGTQICTKELTLNYVNGIDMAGIWTFPAGFVAPPIANHTPRPLGFTPTVRTYQMISRVNSATTSDVSVAAANPSATNVSGDTLPTHVQAIGRWY